MSKSVRWCEDPITFPYEGIPCDNTNLNRDTMFAYMEDKSSNTWDFKRFQIEHFKRFDRRIEQLMEMGIQADLILFHPYDRWGFDGMGAENDDFYVSYVVARYAAYRNVWWSLANEYDYVKTKTIEDWERIEHAKLWWSHGGVLHGDSPSRIAFLYDILKDIPEGKGLQQIPSYWDAIAATTDETKKEFYLFYFSFLRPFYRDLYFDDETTYEVDVIDTWNMEVKPQGVHKGKFRIVLGGKPYMAIRVKKV